MIAFVKEAEALQEKGQLERLKNEEGELKVEGWGWGGVGGSEEGGKGQGGEEGGGDGYSVIRIAIRSINSEFFIAWKPGIEMKNSHSELKQPQTVPQRSQPWFSARLRTLPVCLSDFLSVCSPDHPAGPRLLLQLEAVG